MLSLPTAFRPIVISAVLGRRGGARGERAGTRSCRDRERLDARRG